MCTYCMIGDHFFRYDPPWQPAPPLVPQPIYPLPHYEPWPVDRLKELHDLLDRVKKLEDALGCPCEPAKADYITLIAERITKLEEAAKQRQPDGGTRSTGD